MRPRNVENIKKKLQDAVALAKKALQPPPDIITVNGDPTLSYITVESAKIGDDHFLYVFGSGQDKKRRILFKAPKEKFRTVIFVGLVDCRVFVMEKILKLTFLYCGNCQISIRGGSVGPVEFIKCNSSNIDIRGDASSGSGIPVIQIDMSNGVHFYQRSEEIVYAVCGCTGITGVIVDAASGLRIKQTPMETSMFGEQTFLLFSKKEGIVQIQERYVLNNIVHHLMFHDAEEEDASNKYETLAFSPPNLE